MIKTIICFTLLLFTTTAWGKAKVPPHKCQYGDCYDDIAEGYSVNTKNYQVGLCLNAEGTWLIVTSSKRNSFKRLKTLPSNNGIYEAMSDGASYFLDENNKVFRITKNKKVLVEEKFLKEIDS